MTARARHYTIFRLRTSGSQIHGRDSSEFERRAAEFPTNSSVRVTLDAVLFDEGTLPGADKAGLQAAMRSCLREERELREEMLRQSHSQRRQHRIGLMQAMEASAEPGHLLADACLSHVAAAARILLNLLENSGAEEQFPAWVNQMMGNPVPDPHRGV